MAKNEKSVKDLMEDIATSTGCDISEIEDLKSSVSKIENAIKKCGGDTCNDIDTNYKILHLKMLLIKAKYENPEPAPSIPMLSEAEKTQLYEILKMAKKNIEIRKKESKEEQKKPIAIVNVPDLIGGEANNWLVLRFLLGVGGSEASVLMNKSHYNNEIDMYKSKIPYLFQNVAVDVWFDDFIEEIMSRPAREIDPESKYLFDYGHYMEDFNAEQFQNNLFEAKYKTIFEEQFSVRDGKPHKIIDWEIYQDTHLYKSIEHPTAFADFDFCIRFTFDDGAVEEGIYECKTSSVMQQRKKWLEGTPEGYNCQVRHYMAVRNVTFFIIACVGDNLAADFYAHLGFRDYEFEKELFEAEEHFWFDHVLARKIPEVKETDKEDVLKSLLGLVERDETKAKHYSGEIEKLTKDYLDIMQEIEIFNANISESKKEAKKLEAKIAIAAGEGDKDGRFVDGYVDIDGDDYDIKYIQKNKSLFNKKQYLSRYPEDKKKFDEFTKVSPNNSVSIKLHKARLS